MRKDRREFQDPSRNVGCLLIIITIAIFWIAVMITIGILK